ncbi:MAG: hypothetical protein K8T91_08270 [Planctomycetes bacterium]|nr:hypothetical protein [Planctomycetota bacterium]
MSKAFPLSSSTTEHSLRSVRDWSELAELPPFTPTFVFDVVGIAAESEKLAAVADQTGCRALYAVKALALPEVIQAIAEPLDGLAVSSLAEARIARESLNAIEQVRPRTLQLTLPGLRPDEVAELTDLCDTLVFNSLSQWRRFGAVAKGAGTVSALRINPQLSWLDDDRFDPCRAHSQLGVPLSQLAATWANAPQDLANLCGLHFHTNHRAKTTDAIEATVRHIAAQLGSLLTHAEWLNVGGGYELTEMDDAALAPLKRTATWLREEFDTQLLFEPGGALVRRHGWLVASVVDLFDSDGESMAVLDTSVAHLAELFEYQRPATVLGHNPHGAHAYTLVGSSCLAGDRFGRFRFSEPLSLNQRIVFADVGAYALSKVQQFNGLNVGIDRHSHELAFLEIHRVKLKLGRFRSGAVADFLPLEFFARHGYRCAAAIHDIDDVGHSGEHDVLGSGDLHVGHFAGYGVLAVRRDRVCYGHRPAAVLFVVRMGDHLVGLLVSPDSFVAPIPIRVEDPAVRLGGVGRDRGNRPGDFAGQPGRALLRRHGRGTQIEPLVLRRVDELEPELPAIVGRVTPAVWSVSLGIGHRGGGQFGGLCRGKGRECNRRHERKRQRESHENYSPGVHSGSE